MTDNASFANPIKGRAKEGVERLLLAPVFLIYEIVAVLFPGVLFIILLFGKGNHSVISAFQNPLLGYKTKICIAIALGYLVGKVLSIPADGFRNHFMEKFTQEVQQPNSKTVHELARKFLVGAFYLPGLYASEHALDYLIMSVMTVSFSVTTGVVLLISSCIPGDHLFRWAELVAGLLLLIRGYRGYKNSFEFTVYMLGVTLSPEVQKLLPAGPSLQTAVALFARLAATQIAPQATASTEAQPAVITNSPTPPSPVTEGSQSAPE